MADGRIIIDTRIRKDNAKKDLNELRKDAQATASEISKIDQKIHEAQGDTKLADDLKNAQAAAAATEKELEMIDAALIKMKRSGQGNTESFLSMQQAGEGLREKYNAQLAAQSKAQAAYDRQQASIAGMTAARGILAGQLAETQKFEQQASAIQRAKVGIDELNVVDSGASGGGGGGLGNIEPNYGFEGQNDFLDTLMAAIESGDWAGAGILLADKVNSMVESVDAPAGRTLYQLALDVLEDSGLAPFSGTAPPWKLWEGLADFTATAPLPVKKHKELLQLIAHAACCVLYTDREGYIRIEPANDVQDNFKLDFHTMLARPKVSQIPTLWAVECPAYAYAPEAAASELHKESYTVDGTLELHLTFSQAADVSVAVSGATVAAKAVFAGAVDLTLTGSGEAVVTVTGRKLESSARTVTAPVESPDENGSVETLDNPLITDAAHALAVAEWVRDWLLLRNTYEFEYRGSPELDPGDLIWLESQFAPFAAPARVLKNELSFSGGLKGKMIAKRMVDEE